MNAEKPMRKTWLEDLENSRDKILVEIANLKSLATENKNFSDSCGDSIKNIRFAVDNISKWV